MLQGPSGHDGTVVVFDRDWFAGFLQRESLECVWLYVNERNAMLGGDQCAWRRTEGVAWYENGSLQMSTWREDQTRGGD